MAEEDLAVRHVATTPSPAEFAIFENANVPALFSGCVNSWPAFRLWNPRTGGLLRLRALAGSAPVQVMATTAGSNFYGDIRGHDRVPLPFGTFLDLAEGGKVLDRSSSGAELSFLDSPDVQLYLAQAGIQDGLSFAPLSGLKEDVAIPEFLRSPVSAINLWMSVNGSRSSTHYDPYQNLLCVLVGRKEVKLWPPSAAPDLYPLPIFGEASNHSGVDFANPDLVKFPRFRDAMKSFQSVVLHAGDALFIPEGWYHQVDSESVTIAVNLWWPSEFSLKLGTHMDAYLLRRLLANLLDAEKERIVEDFRGVSRAVPLRVPSSQQLVANGVGGKTPKKYCASSLTKVEMRALRTLILCVSEMMMVPSDVDAKTADEGNHDSGGTIARVFASLNPQSLQRTLLVMSIEYPRTLEALILHRLSPIASEILTRKFEEMDAAVELDCPQEEFYAQIYSVFDEPRLAMASLVDGKEALAAMALERVLDGNLGLNSVHVHGGSL